MMSTVRDNLMNIEGYAPYCGGMCIKMPRTDFLGDQFYCPACGCVSEFPKDFIDEYKKKWNNQ